MIKLNILLSVPKQLVAEHKNGLPIDLFTQAISCPKESVKRGYSQVSRDDQNSVNSHSHEIHGNVPCWSFSIINSQVIIERKQAFSDKFVSKLIAISVSHTSELLM